MQKLINHAASLYPVVKIHGSLQYGAYLYLNSLHVLSAVQVVDNNRRNAVIDETVNFR